MKRTTSPKGQDFLLLLFSKSNWKRLNVSLQKIMSEKFYYQLIAVEIHLVCYSKPGFLSTSLTLITSKIPTKLNFLLMKTVDVDSSEYLYLNKWFSTRGNFAPWGHLTMSGEIFGYHN